MGTRADFYVGIGAEARWLGSHAMDSHPDCLPQGLFAAASPEAWEAAVTAFLTENGRLAALGWHWPWRSSRGSDYAYTFHEGRCILSQSNDIFMTWDGADLAPTDVVYDMPEDMVAASWGTGADAEARWSYAIRGHNLSRTAPLQTAILGTVAQRLAVCLFQLIQPEGAAEPGYPGAGTTERFQHCYQITSMLEVFVRDYPTPFVPAEGVSDAICAVLKKMVELKIGQVCASERDSEVALDVPHPKVDGGKFECGFQRPQGSPEALAYARTLLAELAETAPRIFVPCYQTLVAHWFSFGTSPFTEDEVLRLVATPEGRKTLLSAEDYPFHQVAAVF